MTDTICDTRLACGRVEIRTGVGRRRRWTAQEKGRIVAEALNAGVAVAEIARRHDMSSQHLFNWIGAAKNWAAIASLVETCKLHGVDPQAYFADVLTRLVNLWPQSRLDELMPWAWAAQRSTDRLAA